MICLGAYGRRRNERSIVPEKQLDTCETCRFWKPEETEPDFGECRRLPPISVLYEWTEADGEEERTWLSRVPETYGDFWCGEHKERAASTTVDWKSQHTIDLALSVRTRNAAVLRLGATRAEDLLSISYSAWLRTPGIGLTSVREVFEHLYLHGHDMLGVPDNYRKIWQKGLGR